MDEDKNRFMTELNVLSDNNIALQTNCSVLQERLRVLSSVERHLKNSMTEDVEVDGIFVSNKFFNTMMSEVITKGQKIWEEIQQRLVTVIQRPYQMFQLQDKTEEEDAMSLEMESIKAKFERLQLQVDLELKEKEMLEEKLNKMQMMQKEEELKVKTDEGTTKEKNYDKLVGLLKGIIQKGERCEKPELDKA